MQRKEKARCVCGHNCPTVFIRNVSMRGLAELRNHPLGFVTLLQDRALQRTRAFSCLERRLGRTTLVSNWRRPRQSAQTLTRISHTKDVDRVHKTLRSLPLAYPLLLIASDDGTETCYGNRCDPNMSSCSQP